MSNTTTSPLRRAAQNKARKYRNDHAQNQGDQALSSLSVIFGVAAAGIGAVAFPALWATNFGIGVAMVVTGAVCGGIAGFVAPQALHKAFSTTAFQYLKPSTYKEARDIKKADKQVVTPAPK